MKEALAQAIHHSRQRSAFGRGLANQPLMRRVLADLAVEVEGATALMYRLAEAFDHADADPTQRAFARIATAIGKFWVCKRAPTTILEAMECLGGAGYVEESLLPRLYREAPVNAIWEGSGNIMCLDVLRAMSREPETLAALEAELAIARGADHHLDQTVDRLAERLRTAHDLEADARNCVEGLALVLQASLLIRRAPSPVAEAYLAIRVRERGIFFGSRSPARHESALIERALPSST
jgi:putative acyl-CoA dehydrogenase